MKYINTIVLAGVLGLVFGFIVSKSILSYYDYKADIAHEQNVKANERDFYIRLEKRLTKESICAGMSPEGMKRCMEELQ